MDLMEQLKPQLHASIQDLKKKYGNKIGVETLKQILNDPTNNSDPMVAFFKASVGNINDDVLAPLAEALNKI